MCGQRPARVTYAYNGKMQTIPMKDVNSISKWTKGALARRRFKKLILTKKIQGKHEIPMNFLWNHWPLITQYSHTFIFWIALPYPEYDGNEIKNSEETLFTDKELFIMLDWNRGGKELAWNNFEIPIGKDKFYQGQW